MFEALDRYAPFTDLDALKEASAMPLRKCVRVNTVRCSVEEFKKRAANRRWNIEPVPWCEEGFFVEREQVEDRQAIGKDLLHLLGHIYMQEASSMLPAALLNPQPGEHVLDMCAAPGSKTTQMAAKMQGRGVIVANEPQEKRLWTLKTAIHRNGVTNVILTKKAGQWFAKHMTERFDRVLCDAPCTAQGTVRKDPDALKYASEDNIRKMAKIQADLLEAAVHACKVGGQIVYSTCTLCPEENELLVAQILQKFDGALEVVDPRDGECRMMNGELDKAIQDSITVQEYLRSDQDDSQFTIHNAPFVRLWPQAYNTEGFFCAVLKKTARTKEVQHMEIKKFFEKPLRRTEQAATAKLVQEFYGTSFIEDHEQLFEASDQLMLSTKEVLDFKLPVQDFSLGMPYAKGVKGKSRFRLTHDLAAARGDRATQHILDLTDEQKENLLQGKDAACDPALGGDVVLRWDNMILGMGLAQKGVLKNRIARWVIGQTAE